MSKEITLEDQIKQLDSFYRGELSATETYSHVLDKFADEPAAVTSVLEKNRSSHRHRAEVLEREIRALGGQPSDSSGLWGGFAKAVEAGAAMLGRGPAISVLEEGEDHGLKDYKRDRDDLSPRLRQLVEAELLPEQQRSHDAAKQLKEFV